MLPVPATFRHSPATSNLFDNPENNTGKSQYQVLIYTVFLLAGCRKTLYCRRETVREVIFLFLPFISGTCLLLLVKISKLLKLLDNMDGSKS